MKELLNIVNKHNFLKMGDYKFSPLMELSSGISLEYCKKIVKNTCKNLPLFLCFPDKQSASLWTAISILTNYYFADYINNEVDGISFSKGDKVKIFNCIGQIERISVDKIYLKFKDQGGIPINKLRTQLSRVDKKRVLSKKKRFSKNYSENRSKRNPISKILVPNDTETINQNNLESKVLLIAGRGNVKKLHDLLNETKIYDTPLSKIYPENKNLIIKPDLKLFKDFFDQKEINKLLDFKNSIVNLFAILDIKNAKKELLGIIEKLNSSKEITAELDEQILSFFNDYENEIPGKIRFLENKYPGIKESLPKKLRAVVVNDVNQIFEYPETIAGFLERNIPVIFITNRSLNNDSNLDTYKQLFKSNPDYYRINWSKEKVKEIIGLTNETDFIDQGLWCKSKRYAHQAIYIKVVEGSELDTLAPLLLTHIKEMDEFELLQKAFYTYFYPALYSLKNSTKTNELIKCLVKNFNEVFENIKYGVSRDKVKDFELAVSLALNFTNNTKPIEENDSVFAQLIPSQFDEHLYIPAEARSINLPSSITAKIIFTGYPYSEYSGKYLLNASCVHFVPEIKLLCWPKEASLTYSYLNRRISAGYFTDNINDIVHFRESFLLKNESDFQQEISNYFTIDKVVNVEEQEEALDYIHTFKYKGYGIENGNTNTFTVKCDILNFEDESFMFLPHRSKILAQTEDNNGNLRISKRDLSELNIGDTIFKYVKDRHTMRDIAKSNRIISAHFDKLELWKNILENLFVKCDNSVNKLKLLLDKTKKEYNLIKGNPSKSSIRNWLFDDEFLKPENDNLKIILLANSENEIENKLEKLDISYQNVVAFTISLSSQIKKQIIRQLLSKSLNDLNVKVSGNEILVQARNIISIDKNNIEVDYRNTRKILC